MTGLIRAGLKSKVTPPPLRSPLLRADPRQGERVRSIPSIIYTLSGCPAAGSPGTDLVWQPGKKRGKEGRATRGGLPLPSLPRLSLSAGQLHPHPLERASERASDLSLARPHAARVLSDPLHCGRCIKHCQTANPPQLFLCGKSRNPAWRPDKDDNTNSCVPECLSQ